MIHEHIILDIATERAEQRRRGWKDEQNSAGLFVSYIANYASRWAMPVMFCPQKYSFRNCMVKVAALAVAAIEWAESRAQPSEDEIAAQIVAEVPGVTLRKFVTGDFGEPVEVPRDTPTYGLFVSGETPTLTDLYGEDPGLPANGFDDPRARMPKSYTIDELVCEFGNEHYSLIKFLHAMHVKSGKVSENLRETVKRAIAGK